MISIKQIPGTATKKTSIKDIPEGMCFFGRISGTTLFSGIFVKNRNVVCLFRNDNGRVVSWDTIGTIEMTFEDYSPVTNLEISYSL